MSPANLTAVLLLSFAVMSSSSALNVPDDQGDALIIQPPHGGRGRHSLFLPLFRSSPNSSRGSSTSVSSEPHRRLRNSDGNLPAARMDLHDDLLLKGYYTTRLYIGTPPQKFALIVDTGSSVTYVPCSTCKHCGNHQDLKFNPKLSSTFQPVKCRAGCICDRKRNQCVYGRQYAEMSSSIGVLGEDIVSFGNQSDIAPLRAIFGCANVETGDLCTQHADGIMGLSHGDPSIVDQLVTKGLISNSFSLCYGGMDVGGGAMVLGGISAPADMVFTRSNATRR